MRRKVWVVIKREYLTRVRTRGFIITTVGLPLFSVGIFAVSLALASRQADRPMQLAIVDNLGGLAPRIVAGLTEKLPDGRPLFNVVGVRDRPASESQARQELSLQLRDARLDGYVEIPSGILNGQQVVLHTRNANDYQSARDIARALDSAVIERRLDNRGIHIQDLREVMRGVDLSVVKVSKTGESRETTEALLMQISMVMILYFTLVVYGVMTMRSVLEEKTNRIVEILASSIKPSHLLTGKILGIAGVGTTQYLIWLCAAEILSAYGTALRAAFLPGAGATGLHLPMSDFVYPLVFFLAGYFLYASMYAAIGAIASSEEESQQVQLPVTLLLVACVILYPVIQRAPNSPLAVALTMFPFSSPILMVYRITVQPPPFWQILLSLGICVLTTSLVIQVSAKIYRVGILMYGKRPSLVEVLRWLRFT